MRTLILALLLISFEAVNGQVVISRVELQKNVYVEASIENFNAKKHRIDTCDAGEGLKMICLIDNDIWFGSDDGLGMPEYQLSRMLISINGVKISLDVKGMFNPTYSGKLNVRQFKFKADQPGYSLYGYFSDGAGTYMAQWKIVKGKSMRLKISRDEADFSWQFED